MVNWSCLVLAASVVFLALAGRYEVSGITGGAAYKVDRLTGALSVCYLKDGPENPVTCSPAK
jgi:hypothetical protein